MSKYILNTMYLKPKYVKDPYAPPNSDFAMKKIADDALIMVIKDDETNTSQIKIIERPTIEFFTIKDKETADPWQKMYISRDLVESHTVEYSKRDQEICRYLNILPEYRQLKQNANKKQFDWQLNLKARDELKDFMNRKIYMNPYVYSADENVEVYWKTKMMLENKWDSLPKVLNVSFYDIETLIAHFKTQVDQNNPEAPINVITYCNSKTKQFYALLLRLPEIKSVQDEIEREEEKYIKEYIEEDFKDTGFDLHIVWFDSEIMLIRAFFQLIHEDKPDFALAWNNNYDNKYILGRCKILGIDPKELFCHPDIPKEYRQFAFYEDPQRKDKPKFMQGKQKKGEFSRLWDWILAPGYTTYIDQMSLYSNLRKRSIEKSYKLDAVCEKEIHANKVDLHDFGLTIRNAPIKNFKIFLKYSMRDTLLLWKLEEQNHDLITYIGLTDNTDLRNGTHESLIIRNAFYASFLQNNLVIGNTVDYGVEEKIQGAVVQDPTLVKVDAVTINGQPTKIFKEIIDFDAKSLYPSLMCQHQIGKENHHYRVVSITDNLNRLVMSGERFNTLLQTIDTSIFDLGKELYGLPNIEEVITNIERELKLACKG